MVVIKNQKNKAYILWESLVALGVFAIICSLLLTGLRQARQQQNQLLKDQEILQVAKMAVQTKQSSLTMNGIEVNVEKTAKSLRVYHQDQEVLHVEKN